MPANISNIVTWILRILVAVGFLGPAYMKLSGNEMMVGLFAQIGLGDWFRVFTGLVELIGAIAVLIPMATPWAALGLLCVIVGAIITNAFIVHHDVLHTIPFLVVLLALLYLTRGPVMKLIGGKA